MSFERPFEEDSRLDEGPLGSQAAGDPVTSGFAAPVEPAESAVRRLEDQLRESRENYVRLAADFDNFRKRVARERIDLSDKAQAAFAIRLLDVLDDLDRLAASDATAPIETVRQAVDLVDRKLRKELETAGLERIDPAGEPFDPAVAEAVSILPPPDPARDHTVAATFQTGYRFKGSLVRPAKVQVYSAGGHA